MKQSTTLNHLRRLESLIKDCYSQARIYHLSADDHLANIGKRVWQDSAFRKLPNWAKSRLHGFDSAMWDCMFHHELETRVYLDGQYIYGKDVPKGKWADVEKSEHTWFWKDTLNPF